MSSCLAGAGRAYGIDLEKLVKNPLSSSSTRSGSSSNISSSPSSTISESNSLALSISTRKPRTPRKRPNQTYNEAAALLSTAYPSIFSANNPSTRNNSVPQISGLNWNHRDRDLGESSDLLFPFGDPTHDSSLHPPILGKPGLLFEPRQGEFAVTKGGIDESESNQVGFLDDFRAESILKEGSEEGIESILGKTESNGDYDCENGDSRVHELGNFFEIRRLREMMLSSRCGGRFELGFSLRSSLRQNDDANWWRFPAVDLDQISPRNHINAIAGKKTGKKNGAGEDNGKKMAVSAADKKKKKKKKRVEKVQVQDPNRLRSGIENPDQDPDPGLEPRPGFMLKLNYEGVMEAWSERASLVSDEIIRTDADETDVIVCLSPVDN